MGALIEAGADILACETIPCLSEAKAIVHLLKEFPDTHAWISFSAKDGRHISDGTKAGECAKWLDQHDQVAAVGVNCTRLEHVSSLIGGIKSIQLNRLSSIQIPVNSMTRKRKHGMARHVKLLSEKAPAAGITKGHS